MSRCQEGFESWQRAGYENEEDYNNNQEFIIREELLDRIDREISFNQAEECQQYGDDGYIPEIARNF
jgi:hypothetical protein